MKTQEAKEIVLDFAINKAERPKAKIVNTCQISDISWIFLLQDTGPPYSLLVDEGHVIGAERSETEFEVCMRRLGAELVRIALYGDLLPGTSIFDQFLGGEVSKVYDAELIGIELWRMSGIYFAISSGKPHHHLHVQIFNVPMSALHTLDQVQGFFNRVKLAIYGGTWIYMAKDPDMIKERAKFIASGMSEIQF